METKAIELIDVVSFLDRIGAKYRVGGRYILTTCPLPHHDDRSPSAQIFLNDFFLLCHVCGRFSPYHYMELDRYQKGFDMNKTPSHYLGTKKPFKATYSTFDLMSYWDKLAWLDPEFSLKGIPWETFHEMGWRKNDGEKIKGPGVFIPYFSQTKLTIPFAQVRHDETFSRRFSFLTGAKPTCYGKWNLYPNNPIMIVEGSSDCAVLDFVAVPWIAIPSSSGQELIKELAKWCKNNNVKILYGGDNDEAGDKLKAALGEVCFFRNCQPPKQYKDYGEFYQKEGFDAVYNHTHQDL